MSRQLASLIKSGNQNISPRDLSPRKMRAESGAEAVETKSPPLRPAPPSIAPKPVIEPSPAPSVARVAPAPPAVLPKPVMETNPEPPITRTAPAPPLKKFELSPRVVEPSIPTSESEMLVDDHATAAAPVRVAGATAQRLAAAHQQNVGGDEVDDDEWLDKASSFAHSAGY